MKTNQYEFDFEKHQKLPTILFGDRVFTVNNRRSNMKKFEKIMSETVSGEEQDYLIFECFLGKEAADLITEADLTIPAIEELTVILLAAVNGKSVEDMRAQMGK